jgi:hypothetical protein
MNAAHFHCGGRVLALWPDSFFTLAPERGYNDRTIWPVNQTIDFSRNQTTTDVNSQLRNAAANLQLQSAHAATALH